MYSFVSKNGNLELRNYLKMLFEKKETDLGTTTPLFFLEIPMYRDSSQKETYQNTKSGLSFSNSKT